ncbi:PepSY domain-containing protein [Lactobacillus amylovorus subsp. animalium]|uniref:PepSY domain-containing protein n=1 Tax=Lactobacillus amylovorus subsp. animalium TaxID=3378536 RepID=A0ABD0C258_LACAM|nr:PepSY domain-containing protein [Lactobacillus amylovorus]GMM15326.1 PepSY domain-containing protein [Lactobacillus amylovorus]
MKKSTIKKLSLSAAILGLTVGGAGVLINQANASTGAVDTQTSQTNNINASSIGLSQSDAINKFNEKFGSVSIKEIELKAKNGKYVYEIEGFDSQNEYKAKIDANSGNILKSKTEKLDADDKNEALDLGIVIDREQATQVAQQSAQGQQVKWVLEKDDGKTIWEIEFENGNKETEVEVDANSQKVLKTKTEDDHKDKDHDKDDHDGDDKHDHNQNYDNYRDHDRDDDHDDDDD